MNEIKAIKGKMRIFKIKIVVMATLMLLGLASCGKQENVYAPPKEEQRLVVYTSHKAAVYDAIIQEFEERTGIWVEVVTGGTTELLDSIAKGNTGADVMFGGGVDSLSVYAENFRVNHFFRGIDTTTL